MAWNLKYFKTMCFSPKSVYTSRYVIKNYSALFHFVGFGVTMHPKLHFSLHFNTMVLKGKGSRSFGKRWSKELETITTKSILTSQSTFKTVFTFYLRAFPLEFQVRSSSMYQTFKAYKSASTHQSYGNSWLYIVSKTTECISWQFFFFFLKFNLNSLSVYHIQIETTLFL